MTKPDPDLMRAYAEAIFAGQTKRETPKKILERIHMEALKAANKRKCAYVDVVTKHECYVEIKHNDTGVYTVWRMALISDKLNASLPVVFMDDKKTSACPLLLSGSCPTRAAMSPEEKELTRTWRCQFRWLDAFDCAEGPATSDKKMIRTQDANLLAD